MIRFYQRSISPAKPPCCRFSPSCSAYAIEAIEKRGAIVGLSLAFFRILRCNPFSKGGYDPVPERGQKMRDLRRKVPPATRFLDAAEPSRVVLLPRPDPALLPESDPIANENETDHKRSVDE